MIRKKAFLYLFLVIPMMCFIIAGFTSYPVSAVSLSAPGNTWRILETDRIAVDLIRFRDPVSSRTGYTFRFSGEAPDVRYIKIKDILLNKYMRLADEIKIFIEDKIEYRNSEELNSVAALKMKNRIRSISGNITIMSTDYEEIYNAPFFVSLDDAAAPDVIIDPCRGVYAETQTIYESDDMRIVLLGFGQFVSDSWYDEEMKGKYLIENRGDHTIHAEILGMAVNGVYQDPGVFNPLDKFLRPGHACVGSFELNLYRLPDEGIDADSISDLKLHFSISSEEQISYRKSNIWCPVELAGAKKENDIFDEGELIYDQEGIRVGFRGAEIDREFEDWLRQVWKLSFINESDRDIYFMIEDISAEDASQVQVYYNSVEVGAHTRRYLEMKTEQIVEKLRFRLHVRTQNDEKLLFTTDEFTLMYEEEK